MAVVRKKQDDKNLKILREIVTVNGNKECFDCGQKGTTYVNMTIGSFVCTRCSGILRGLTPPQRVKSISMATFSTDELDFIRSNGNDNCAKTWMGLWDPKRIPVQDHRELLVDKYEKKRYYLEPASPLKSITTSSSIILGGDNVAAATSALKVITLTPPTSLRLYKNNSQHLQQQQQQIQLQQQQQQLQQQQQQNSNATNNFKQQFTPDDNSRLFHQTTNQQQLQLQQQQQQIRLNHNNHNNNLDTNAVLNNRNGINLAGTTTATNIKNGLNIGIDNNNKFTPDTEFIADFSSANIFNSTNNIPTSTTIKTIQQQHNNNNNINNHINSNHNNLNNGKMNGTTKGGGVTSIVSTNGENFADFDHNPIYNAAVANQNSNMQWNVWQQFQWPYVQPEQNRWSLPMSLSSTSNSLHSSGTYNSNSSISSTPSADRYAALKDLDEQLRENKEKADTNIFNTQAPSATVNPFKTGNPFQQQQQQQQLQLQQQQQLQQQVHQNAAWPQDSLFTPTNNGPSQYSHLQQQQYQHMNGFASQLNNVGNAGGFPQQHGIAIGTGFGNASNAHGNPFASTNNPFL